MSHYSYPDRLYLLSDTYGGHEAWDPLKSPDIDARIATDIRSCIEGVRREFDIFGGEFITDHVLRTIVKLHGENGDDCVIGTTGVFINHEPRTTQGQNGNSFYLAEVGPQIKVVATPVGALSAIKERVTALYHLPNEDNGLYEAREQFRSSYTVVLLAADHGLKLVEDDPKIVIPDYPSGCRLAYVDRFGNLVLYEHSVKEEKSVIGVIRKNTGNVYQLALSGIRRNVLIDTSLSEALPGTLVAYLNDGHIEVVSKWYRQYSPKLWSKQRLKDSAFEKFHRPAIGSSVWVQPFIRRFKKEEVPKAEEHLSPSQNTFSDRLRERMKKSGYSGYRISQLTDVDEATISRFLTGQSGLSSENIDKLVSFLGLDLVMKS